MRGLDINERIGLICFVKVGVKIGRKKIMKEPVCIYIVYSV